MDMDRVNRMREMVNRFPDDARARYFLAHELMRLEDWAGAAAEYAEYLRLEPGDEGNGYRNYGVCLERLGRPEESAGWYRKGVESALAHNHEGLAAEIRDLLETLEDEGRG